MINALRRVPINGINKKLFILDVSTSKSTVSPLLFSSSSSSSKILSTFSKSNFLQNNNYNKRFFSNENNKNNIQSNDTIGDTAKSTSFTNDTVGDLSTTTAAAASSSPNTEVIADVISNKVLPSYILKPTMGPDSFKLAEWSHQLNFDLIAILNDFHEQYGLPWISIFVGTAVTIRLLTLPLAIRNQRDAAKMRLVKVDMENHSYLNDGTQEGRIKVMEFQKKLFKKYDTSPMKTLGLNMIQLPFIIYPFVFLRQLSDDTSLLQNAGALWFKNLSLSDPYFILPLISAAFQYGSVRLSMNDDVSPIMKTIMSSLCFLPLIFTIHFAASLNIYWAVNSMIFAFTNWFLKSERGCKLFNIPYFKNENKAKKIIEAPGVESTATTTKKTSSTTIQEDEKKSQLRKELQDQIDMIEKKKQELKRFGRGKK
ncbi:hypothetical protein ACTFIU_006578 [Dictyostelium citrinum]